MDEQTAQENIQDVEWYANYSDVPLTAVHFRLTEPQWLCERAVGVNVSTEWSWHVQLFR